MPIFQGLQRFFCQSNCQRRDFIIKGGLRQYTYIIFLKANKTGKGKNTCRFLGVSNLPHYSSDFPIREFDS